MSKSSTESRFLVALNEILKENFSSRAKVNNENVLTQATVNTRERLVGTQLASLAHLAIRWATNLRLSRSGAGIKMEFILDPNMAEKAKVSPEGALA